MTTTILETVAGTSIYEVAQELVDEATRTFSVARTNFNGFQISAAPFSSPSRICKEYKAFCERKYREYQNSPQGKARAAKEKEEALAKLNADPREFPVEVVLSVITGKLLAKPGAGGSKNGVFAIYDFIGHCLASDCFDIVSPSMADFLRPLLIDLFPELKIALEKESHLERLLCESSPVSSIAINLWIFTLDLPKKYLVPVLVKKQK